jgi:hypothetical protein
MNSQDLYFRTSLPVPVECALEHPEANPDQTGVCNQCSIGEDPTKVGAPKAGGFTLSPCSDSFRASPLRARGNYEPARALHGHAVAMILTTVRLNHQLIPQAKQVRRKRPRCRLFAATRIRFSSPRRSPPADSLTADWFPADTFLSNIRMGGPAPRD